MTANDEVVVREFLTELLLCRIAAMIKQNVQVTLIAHPLVFGNGLLLVLKLQPDNLVGMNAGRTTVAQLNHAQDTYTYTVHVEELIGQDIQPVLMGVFYIGTEMTEMGQIDQAPKSLYTTIKLMVAQGGGIKANGIHHSHHGIGRNTVLVIDGASRTVIAGRKHQQVGINRTNAVHDISQHRHLLHVGVHVVNGDDSHLLFIRHSHRGQH